MSPGTLTRRRKVAIGAGAAVALGLVLAWPGGPPREAVAAVTKYRECFITAHESSAPDATVALGDSITAGASNPVLHVGANNSYFDVLACRPHSPVAYVGNAGVWGNTTGQMLARVDADVIAKHPARVLVLGGTNDVRQHATADTLANLTRIRAELTAAGIQSVFGLLPPSQDMPAETMAFNTELRSWAAREGVTLIDYWTPLAKPDGTYRDGMNADSVHPSPAGARVMADAAAAALS